MDRKKDEKKSKDEKSTQDQDCTETESKQVLKPVRPKIGESSDNLKQRAEWYQKRTGK
jgi:hypothetical protein